MLGRLSSLCLVALVACGPATPDPLPPVTVPPPTTAAPAATVAAAQTEPDAPDAAALPQNPAIAGVVARALIDTVLARVKGSRDGELFLTHFNIAGLIGALHVDAARPLALALEGASPEEEALVAKLAPLMPKKEIGSDKAPGMRDKLRQVLGERATRLHLRVIVPSTSAVAAMAELPKALEAGHLQVDFVSPKRVVTKLERHAAVSFTLATDAIVVDLAVADGLTQLEPWRSSSLAAREAPLALEGRGLRLRWSPERCAELGFLHGLLLTLAAVAGESIEPDQRDRVAAEGAFESTQNLLLAAGPRGAYFDHEELDVDASATKMELRLEPGRGFAPIPDAAWAPGSAAVLGNASVTVDVSSTLRKAWTLPAASGRELIGMARNAGAAGMLLAAPFLPVAWPVEGGGNGAAILAAQDHFERVTFADVPDGGQILLGLLPEKTSRADAACALTATTKCPKKEQLAVGKTLTSDGWSARLYDVKGRLVVAASRRAPSIEKLSIEVQTGAAPLRIAASGDAVKALGNGKLAADMTHEGATLVLRLH